MEFYIKKYDICLTLKAVWHKFYRDLQLLFISIYYWKDLLKNFIICLLLSTNWKNKSYKLILIIINCLIKMVYYKQVKVIITATKLIRVIIDMVVLYHGFSHSIINDYKTIFTFKFWSLFCYFLSIKR